MEVKTAFIVQLTLDTFLFILADTALALLFLLASPFRRGFFCDDQSIRYPFRGDTVPTGLLFGVAYFMALGSFLAAELQLWLSQRPRPGVGRMFWALGKVQVLFLFGAAATTILTEVGKLTIGRLRPCFMDLCRPDFSAIDCTAGYVTEFNCTNPMNLSEHKLLDVRKSFPSGHASFGVFTAIFVVRLTVRHSALLKMTLQLLVVAAALFTALSRVSDNRHHWSDVLAGSVLGAGVAVWTVIALGSHVCLSLGSHVTASSRTPIRWSSLNRQSSQRPSDATDWEA